MVLNGSIYKGPNAALSKRIWNNEALQGGQIENIIATGVAEGRSAMQVAKDLQAYVNPKAQMPDHWNDIYPIPFNYAVDYNAKRLAVTAMNHAYYQGMIMAARENPFAEFLHWELSSGHEIYDVCDTYMEHDEGLGLGNFALDNAPLPHPWCRCTWYVDSAKSLKEIGNEIGDWVAGGENPKLDQAFGKWKQNGIANSSKHGTIIVKRSNSLSNLSYPMDRQKYEKMSAALLKQGIRCLSAIDGDELRYLQYMGAEAIMQWPNQILHMGSVPSASAFFEEIIHLDQYRKIWGKLLY